MTFAEVRGLELFDGVTDEQLHTLVDASEEITFEPGQELWQAGTPSAFWWINIEGTIDMVRVARGEETLVGQFHVPGRWAGGFGAWDEHGVYFATGRATSHGRLLKVPVSALRMMVDALPLFGHLAEGLFHTARGIEANARQREALVALGTLSAGLAHKLNNPASAAQRAVDSLEESMTEALSALDRLAGGDITAAQFTGLDALRREAMTRPVVLDPLALVDREDELSAWLTEHRVERDWIIAPALAARGVDVDWCERMTTVLDGRVLTAGFEWVTSTVTLRALLGEVKESTRRISDLVAAVKSYSQMDRGALQTVDVTEGIESTMVMLGHKLREGVAVVRDYRDDVPLIEAHSGELNQVWTNLIDNAVDAMDGSGTLTIATGVDGDSVLVEIGDSGVGMPPEVVERAFETFFTTKDVGKGTGLGLDIARRIVVERHHGTITIESEPGRTVLRVRLPIRPPG